MKLKDPLNKFLSIFIDCQVCIIAPRKKLKFRLLGIFCHPVNVNIVLILDNHGDAARCHH
jgi:hypothetical protein